MALGLGMIEELASQAVWMVAVDQAPDVVSSFCESVDEVLAFLNDAGLFCTVQCHFRKFVASSVSR